MRIEADPGAVVRYTATWDQLVDLALLEIADCGRRGQVQISRRLVALVDDLIPGVR